MTAPTLPSLTVRERIVFTAIVAAPGAYMAQVSRLADLPITATDRAVLALERKKLVRTECRPGPPVSHGNPPQHRRHCYPIPEALA